MILYLIRREVIYLPPDEIKNHQSLSFQILKAIIQEKHFSETTLLLVIYAIVRYDKYIGAFLTDNLS